MSEPHSDGGWTAHGGIEADADDIYAMAAATRRAGAAAERAALSLSAHELLWGPAVALLDPRVGPAPGLALAMALALPFTLHRCARDLHDRGLSLVRAAEGYVGAENLAAALLRRVDVTLAYNRKFALRDDLPTASTVDPDSLVEPLAGLAADLYIPRPAAVGPATDLGAGPGPSGLADVLALVDGTIPGQAQAVGSSLPENRIDVAAVSGTGTDGLSRTTYVVALPGTSAWDLPFSADPSPAVRTLEANLRLMAGQTTAEVAALPAALAAAGVPSGAAVMLVGHSQGGMTAYAAAADSTMRRTYRVTHVVTAGSPIGAMPAPAGVRVLSLENVHDLVPTLDGRPNADSVGRVTVRFDGGHEGADQAGSVRTAHDMAEYRTAAQRVDGARSGPLGEFVTSAREQGYLLEPGRGTARLTRVELHVQELRDHDR